MNKILWILLVCILCSCQGMDSGNNKNTEDGEEIHQSVRSGGKWSTDQATAQELKAMKNTIENFTLLNKKKFENLKAYQEFGDLMQMHIDRVNEYCRMDADSKNMLCKNLNRIKDQVNILHGNDMGKSKEAIHTVNVIFNEVDSTFDFKN